MFLKIKKLTYILVILVVVAGSFASSFFVYPAQKAEAATCPNRVLVSKEIVSKDEIFKVYASSASDRSSSDCYMAMDGDDFFVISFWSGNSTLSTELFSVTLHATYNKDGANNNYALEAGQTFKASDILKTLDGTNGGSFYVYVARDWEYIPVQSKYINASGTKVTVEAGSKTHPDTTVIDDSQVQSTPSDASTADCSASSSGELEFALTKPIKLFYKNALGFNARFVLPPSLAQLCKNVQSDQDPGNDVFISLYNIDRNDVLDGKQASGFKGNPVLTNGILTGFTGGQSLIVNSFLTPAQRTSFEADKNFTVTMHLQAFSRVGQEIPFFLFPNSTTSKGVAIAPPVEVIIVGDEAQASAVDPSFVQEIAQAGGGGGQELGLDKAGGTITDFLAQIIGTIIKWIQEILYTIFGFVVLPLIETLLAIPTYTDNFAAVILPGWELLRNLSNIFFILVLLVIGLGTLFRVQGYQYKNLLMKLIFAAFAVNFSLVLTQSFLAVAETAQFQFLPVTKEGGSVIKVIANQLMVAPLNQNVLTPTEASQTLTRGLSLLVFPFFYLALTFMAFVVLCSIAFFLVARMIVIWILLMSSPIAIVARVIPQTKRFSDMWLSALFQYGFFVTILGFFLNVTAYLAQRQEGVLKALDTTNKSSSLADFLSRIATIIFVMGFLVAGLKLAGGMKVIGAGKLNKLATKAGKLPFDFLKGVGKFAGERGFEGAQNLAGVTVDPRIWKKDWDSYLKRRQGEADERLLKRRMGSGAMKKVPGRIGVGSPAQLFENLGTWDGWMKMVKTPKQIINKKRSEYAKDALGAMTEEERLAQQQKLNDATLSRAGALGLISNDEITGKTASAKKLSEGIKSKQQELESQAKELQDEANLVADPAEQNRLRLEAAAIYAQAGELKAKAEELDLLDGSKGLNEISNDLSDANKEVFRALAEDIKTGLEKDVKEYDKTMKELKDKELKDDKIRENNNFSKFDPNGKERLGEDYKDVTDEKKKKLAKEAADFGDVAKKLQFKSLISEEKEKRAKKGKIKTDYEEQGVETGDDITHELGKQIKSGGKDKKERIEALLEMAAKIGALPEALQAISKKPRGTSYNDFVDTMKDLKVEAGFSDNEILKLAHGLGKTSKANKDFAFAFAVQRVGGDLGWMSEGSHNKEVSKSMARITNPDALKLPSSALFETSAKDASGKSTKKLTEEAIKRIKGMSASEAKSLNSRLSPEVAHNVITATNASEISGMDQGIRKIFESKAALHA